MKLLVVSFYPVLYLIFTLDIYCDIARHFRALSTVKILRIKDALKKKKINHNLNYIHIYIYIYIYICILSIIIC